MNRYGALIMLIAGALAATAARADERSVERQQLSVSSEPGHTRVRIDGYTNYPGNLVHLFAEEGAKAHLRVQVPRGSQLSVTGVSADIHSTGVAGAQHLQPVSGNIEADVFQAPVEVRTVNGDIRLLGVGMQGKSAPPVSAAMCTWATVRETCRPRASAELCSWR
jgi:hypothetical protein